MDYQRISLPATPVVFTGDYAVPEQGIHQLFRWRRGYHEWHLTVYDPLSQHAGFLLKRPLVIPFQRGPLSLYFELRPPEAAEFLAIGLRDDMAAEPEEIDALAIAPYRVQPRDAEIGGHFVIPLDHLERLGTLNWRNICGAQVTLLGEYTLPTPNIVIRLLQIAPTQTLEQRFRD